MANMPSLNGPIRNMADRLGIVVPSIGTMQNQGRFQAQWLFDILREMGVGPLLTNLFELLQDFEPGFKNGE